MTGYEIKQSSNERECETTRIRFNIYNKKIIYVEFSFHMNYQADVCSYQTHCKKFKVRAQL